MYEPVLGTLFAIILPVPLEPTLSAMSIPCEGGSPGALQVMFVWLPWVKIVPVIGVRTVIEGGGVEPVNVNKLLFTGNGPVMLRFERLLTISLAEFILKPTVAPF